MNNPKILTAIFVSGKNTPAEHWYKYRGIANNQRSIFKFVQFAKSKGAEVINFYSKETSQFWQQIIISDR